MKSSFSFVVFNFCKYSVIAFDFCKALAILVMTLLSNNQMFDFYLLCSKKKTVCIIRSPGCSLHLKSPDTYTYTLPLGICIQHCNLSTLWSGSVWNTCSIPTLVLSKDYFMKKLNLINSSDRLGRFHLSLLVASVPRFCHCSPVFVKSASLVLSGDAIVFSLP